MALPDRIDFKRIPDGRMIVTKFQRESEQRRDIPIDSSVKTPDFDLEWALAWCEENGYAIRRWPTGARAWKAEQPWVIRTRREIWRLRQKWDADALAAMRRDPGKWHAEESMLSLDLAYEG